MLSLCGIKFINNFVCEHSAIAVVSCSDPYLSQKVILIFVIFDEISNLIIVLASYIFICIAVTKMSSTGGLCKALSTCTSHLTAITIFHGTIIFPYCFPTTESSWLLVKIALFSTQCSSPCLTHSSTVLEIRI